MYEHTVCGKANAVEYKSVSGLRRLAVQADCGIDCDRLRLPMPW